MILLLCCVVVLFSVVTATQMKIDLNYAKDKTSSPMPATVSNSHTGITMKGQGNTVTSKVSAENFHQMEQKKDKEKNFRKKGEISMDSYTQSREMTAKRTVSKKKTPTTTSTTSSSSGARRR